MKDVYKPLEGSDAELEAQLTSQLYRYDCATPDELQQYAWRMLATEAANKIEQHCQHCIDCRHMVAQHQQIFQNMATIQVLPEPVVAEAVAETVAEALAHSPLVEKAKEKVRQVQVIVAELVDDVRDGVSSTLDAFAPSPQLAHAAVRGGEANRHSPLYEAGHERTFLYKAGEAEIDLQLRSYQAPLVMISGQVMLDTLQVDDSPEGTTTGRFRLTPQSNTENEPVAGNLDKHGCFSIDGVKSGAYQLTIELPEATYTILDLAVD